jgi:hypothetical protein
MPLILIQKLIHLWPWVICHCLIIETLGHYCVQKEFILVINHEVLKYINEQHKLNKIHVLFLEFTFSSRHQSDRLNNVIDTLAGGLLFSKPYASLCKVWHLFIPKQLLAMSEVIKLFFIVTCLVACKCVF